MSFVFFIYHIINSYVCIGVVYLFYLIARIAIVIAIAGSDTGIVNSGIGNQF